MMRLFCRPVIAMTLSLLVCVVPAQADDPPAAGLAIPADLPKSLPDGGIAGRSSKAAPDASTPAVRFAMCGVEADTAHASLDAGLIDFNLPVSARAATAWSGDPQNAGRNVHDYQTPVFLGVTVGYRF